MMIPLTVIQEDILTTAIRTILLTTLLALSVTATWPVAQNRFAAPKTIVHVSLIQWKEGVPAAAKKQAAREQRPESPRPSGSDAAKLQLPLPEILTTNDRWKSICFCYRIVCFCRVRGT